MYLLDTNACIQILKKSSVPVIEKLQKQDNQDVKLCSIVKAELLYGARHSKSVKNNLILLSKFFEPFGCFSFDDFCAEEYGKIRANLADRGLMIGPNDLMIASIAKVHNLILVTHNTGEFKRVDGLQIEDWE